MFGRRVETACLTMLWRSGVGVVDKSRGFGLNVARGENLGLGVAGEYGGLGLGVSMLAFSVGLV